MSPWPPKMATGPDFVKKAVDNFIGAGGEREGFAHPHLKRWQGTLAFSTTLWHLSTPIKIPPATSQDASAPGPPASEPSVSWTPSSGPPTPGRTSSSLLDLQILAWPQANGPPAPGPSAPGPPAPGPPAHEPCALQQRQCGLAQQEREWWKANLN